MKNILILLLIMASQNVFSSTEDFNKNTQTQSYHEGLEAIKEAKHNQELWAHNEGNPEMARAYQDGLKAAKEGSHNQELWARNEGDPEMARAYQDGLKAAMDAMHNHELNEG